MIVKIDSGKNPEILLRQHVFNIKKIYKIFINKLVTFLSMFPKLNRIITTEII